MGIPVHGEGAGMCSVGQTCSLGGSGCSFAWLGSGSSQVWDCGSRQVGSWLALMAIAPWLCHPRSLRSISGVLGSNRAIPFNPKEMEAVRSYGASAPTVLQRGWPFGCHSSQLHSL